MRDTYFAGWEVVGAEVTEKDNTISFTMPEGPVVVKAYFEKPYTVKYYENEINKANYLGTVPCATNGKENSYPGTYDIAASREDVNGFDSSKNYEGYSFWKEENGQLVAGEKYTVNVAEDRTMTYGEQEKYEYIFVVKAPKEMHDAQITVTYKDAGGNVLQDAKSLAVTFNPDSLLEGKVALGSLIAEEGALEALLEKYIWVQAEGKEYQLTNRPAENTEIAMTAGQNEGTVARLI